MGKTAPGTRQRVVETTVVLLVMLNVGINVGIYSPTLPDIMKLTSCSTSQISTTLVWTGIASIAGSLAVGPLFDRFNGLLLMAACLAVQGVAIGIAPTWSHLYSYQICVGVAQFFNFALTSGCLSVNCNLWKSFPAWVSPIVQATDLMHALGTALTPQIIRPFITGAHSPTPSVNNLTTTPPAIDWLTTSTHTPTGGMLPVQKAYFLVAVYDAVMALVCLLTVFWSTACCRRPSRIEVPYYPVESADDHLRQLLQETAPGLHQGGVEIAETTAGGRVEPRSRLGVRLLAVMFVFFTVNGGRDALLSGLLFTYVNKYLTWSVGSSTLLVTLYHVTRVVVHAVLVPLSRYVTPTRLTVANHVVVLVSGALMCLAAAVGWTFTGAGVIVTGFATSNMNPTSITLVDETVRVSAAVMGLLMSGAAAGQIVFAPLSGWLLEETGSPSFPAMLLGLGLAGTALFVVYCLLVQSAADRDVLAAAEVAVERRRERGSVAANDADDEDDLFTRRKIINRETQ